MANKELSFEECLKELEEIVSKLESKDISLDDAVKYYQKGLELSKLISLLSNFATISSNCFKHSSKVISLFSIIYSSIITAFLDPSISLIETLSFGFNSFTLLTILLSL